MHPIHRTLAAFGTSLVGLMLVGIISAAQAQLAEPLDPEIAFALDGQLDDDGQSLSIRFKVEKGYYLYRPKIRVQWADAPPDERLGDGQFPAGELHTDAYFGATEIYRGGKDEVLIRFPISALVNTMDLRVFHQGCADIGICYPPQEQRLILASGNGWQPPTRATAVNPLMGMAGNFSDAKELRLDSNAAIAKTTTDALTAEQNVGNSLGETSALSDTDQIARSIGERGLLLSLLVFFGLGLALSLTPCNLPMVPILGALITGSLKLKDHDRVHIHDADLHHTGQSRWRGLLLAASFVLGMSLAFALVGALAGLTGQLLSAQLQRPEFQMFAAMIMVVLAAGCFGWYSMQLPHALQNWLRGRADQQKQGSVTGLIVSGALSALIVGPCVAAPLAGALIYIGQQGTALGGALLLFALAWGQGVPLLAFGLFADRFMPKLGAWMNSINRIFGFLLLAVAIYFISPLLDTRVLMLFGGTWLLVSAVFLRATDALPEGAHGVRRIGKAIGVILLIYGVALYLGWLSGGKSLVSPLSHWFALPPATTQSPAALSWKQTNSVGDLESQLAVAGERPVLLDFYADWCVSCHEMEAFTFADPSVSAEMQHWVLLRADVTANKAEQQALLKRFNLFGPPALIFFQQGQENRSARLVGYEKAQAFLSRLQRAR